MALEKGFYRDQGIDLRIIKGGPERPPSEWLEKGAADFGSLMLTQAVRKRAGGLKLVHIGQIVQRSALLLVAKKSRGLRTPEDLQGKKVGLWGPEFQIQPLAFFQKYRLNIRPVRQSRTVNLFLREAIDAASAMRYNELHLILNAGLNPEELTVFSFADEGLNFPEDGLYCLERTFQKNPDLACRFVRASLAGWRYAFEHPEEALDLVMKIIRAENLGSNRAHQRWMLQQMKELIRPLDPNQIQGTLAAEDYRRVGQAMVRQGWIPSLPPLESFRQDCLHGQ